MSGVMSDGAARRGVRDIVACLALVADDEEQGHATVDGLDRRVREIMGDPERMYWFCIAATAVVSGMVKGRAHATGLSADEATAQLFRAFLEEDPA